MVGYVIGGVLAIVGLTAVGFGLYKDIKNDRNRRKAKLAAFRAAISGKPLPRTETDKSEAPKNA